jgi:hypothetical protein
MVHSVDSRKLHGTRSTNVGTAKHQPAHEGKKQRLGGQSTKAVLLSQARHAG